MSRKIGDGLATVLHNLGYVVQHEGDYWRGAALVNESLALYREQQDQIRMELCIDGLAGIVAGQRQLEFTAEAALQLRWFDRWLKEVDNGVEQGASPDLCDGH